MLCDYGCGQPARYEMKNGKKCCSKTRQSCPAMRIKSIPKGINIFVNCAICGKSIPRSAQKRHESNCKNNKCLICGEAISNRQKFCSSKCSYIKNSGSLIDSRKSKLVLINACLNCGKEISTKNTYCNNHCQNEYFYNRKIAEWLCGNESGNSKAGASKYIKTWLLKVNNNSCSLCGWDKINPKSGITPLEIHHIDGNSQNNRPENLELLCPNCHSLTENYKALNKTSSRKYRKSSPLP